MNYYYSISPQLNAAKKIVFYKIKQRKVWLNDKNLSIAALKEILDQISPDILKGWINSSRTKIMNKLKNFNKEVANINIQFE